MKYRMKIVLILTLFIAFAGCAKAEDAKNTKAAKKTKNRTVIIKGKKINVQYAQEDGKYTGKLTRDEIKIIYEKFIPTLIQAFTKNNSDYFYNTLLAKFKHGFSVDEWGTVTLYRGKEARDKFNKYLLNKEKKLYYYDEFANMFKNGAVSQILVARRGPQGRGIWKQRVVFFSNSFQFSFFLVIDDGMPVLIGFQCIDLVSAP